MLNFKIVESQKLIFSKGPVVAADTTNLEAKFEVNDLFDGTLRAYWNVRGSAVDSFMVDLDASGSCTIPSEVLASISDPSMYGDIDHILQVSVVSIGEDDTIRITSTTCEIPVYKSSYTGNISQPGEPSGDGNITNIITGAAINGEQMDFYNGNNVIFSTSLANLKNFLLPIAGGAMTGNINMANHTITGLADAMNNGDALSKAFAKTLFAPSGYGLGEISVMVDNVDDVTVSGFYQFLSDLNGYERNYLLIHQTHNESYMSQIAIKVDTGEELHRLKLNGVWQPWEWVNPTMTVGVEYRTTERWNGRPVYVQLVDFGALPNNTTKQISISAIGVTAVISYDGRFSDGTNGASLLGLNTVNSNYTIASNVIKFNITTTSNQSSMVGNATVKYVK